MPPAPPYATIYGGIWELEFLPYYAESLVDFVRYIDDGLGLWVHHLDPGIDAQNWLSFQASMNSYGTLDWEFSERLSTANFLDLTLHVTSSGIRTRLYKKPLNLYLYIPPHSCHPPGIL